MKHDEAGIRSLTTNDKNQISSAHQNEFVLKVQLSITVHCASCPLRTSAQKENEESLTQNTRNTNHTTGYYTDEEAFQANAQGGN